MKYYQLHFFQNIASCQLCFIMIIRSMNTSLSIIYCDEHQHESLSPIKQLFATPCLFEQSCKELLENTHMLALSIRTEFAAVAQQHTALCCDPLLDVCYMSPQHG